MVSLVQHNAVLISSSLPRREGATYPTFWSELTKIYNNYSPRVIDASVPAKLIVNPSEIPAERRLGYDDRRGANWCQGLISKFYFGFFIPQLLFCELWAILIPTKTTHSNPKPDPPNQSWNLLRTANSKRSNHEQATQARGASVERSGSKWWSRRSPHKTHQSLRKACQHHGDWQPQDQEVQNLHLWRSWSDTRTVGWSHVCRIELTWVHASQIHCRTRMSL